MPTYLGLDVLDVNPNRSGPLQESFLRDFDVIDNKTGKIGTDEHAAAPTPTRNLIWTARGRSGVAAMRAFLDARKGRAVPFWLPSYQQDLRLSEDMLQNASIANVVWVRYTQQMFPGTGGRRHIAFFEPHLAMTFHKVTDANDPGDWVTESLTLDPVAPRLYPAATSIVSFLKLCRLDEDEVEINWLGKNVAEAAIKVRELPNEAPE